MHGGASAGDGSFPGLRRQCPPWQRRVSAGSVLQRFLGLYASINSFVKLVIRRRSPHDRDELWKEWEPVGGDQRLL